MPQIVNLFGHEQKTETENIFQIVQKDLHEMIKLSVRLDYCPLSEF